MTTLLSITASPDAPVACDMTGAGDTLADRLAEYRRLFEHALLSRESSATATTFRFAARPGVRQWLLDLVRREAACCPFLSYEVADEGEQLVWTTTGLGGSAMAALDAFFSGADGANDSSTDLARELEQRTGVRVVVPSTDR